MPTVDLVGLDAEAIADDTALPVGGKKRSWRASTKRVGTSGPSLERVWLAHRHGRLRTGVGAGLCPDVVGHVMQEDLDGVEVRPDLHGVTGRGPPVGLARSGHHGVEQHQQLDRPALRHQRRDEAAQRLADDDQLAAVADRLEHSSVYSASPADSSPTGRFIVTTSWPRSSSSGVTRCQYQASPPAPWIKT